MFQGVASGRCPSPFPNSWSLERRITAHLRQRDPIELEEQLVSILRARASEKCAQVISSQFTVTFLPALRLRDTIRVSKIMPWPCTVPDVLVRGPAATYMGMLCSWSGPPRRVYSVLGCSVRNPMSCGNFVPTGPFLALRINRPCLTPLHCHSIFCHEACVPIMADLRMFSWSA